MSGFPTYPRHWPSFFVFLQVAGHSGMFHRLSESVLVKQGTSGELAAYQGIAGSALQDFVPKCLHSVRQVGHLNRERAAIYGRLNVGSGKGGLCGRPEMEASRPPSHPAVVSCTCHLTSPPDSSHSNPRARPTTSSPAHPSYHPHTYACTLPPTNQSHPHSPHPGTPSADTTCPPTHTAAQRSTHATTRQTPPAYPRAAPSAGRRAPALY